MSCSSERLNPIVKAVKEGSSPVYIMPYREKKVWGVQGIGEYWYGAEKGEKSSVAQINDEVLSMDKLMDAAAVELIGKEVINKFGNMLPLTKILTPNNRLSVQFHDSKNELWVVTGIDKDIVGDNPYIILGFSPASVEKYSKDVGFAYRKALEIYGERLNVLIDKMEGKGYLDTFIKEKDVFKAAEKLKDKDEDVASLLEYLVHASSELDWFYAKRTVEIGDVIPVPSGTLHALGSGIQVLEPQIPGPTQSMEDGATYPVRYAFPGHSRETASKVLDLDRVEEIIPSVAGNVCPDIIERTDKVTVEKLPGGFEDKGMEVRRITMVKGSEILISGSFSDHLLAIVNNDGKAMLVFDNKDFSINRADPGESLMLVPSSIKDFKIRALEDVQIIDTFTPV